LRLQIVNAKDTPLSDDEVRSIVEIELHPKVRQWLITDMSENFEEEYEAYKSFFRNLPKNREVEVLYAK